MGNYKFRLSHMMPNAWFYKLRDFTKTGNHETAHHHHHHHPIKKKLPSPISRPRPEKFRINSPTNPKASDTKFPDHHPPRNSSNTRSTHRKALYKPSPPLVTSSSSAACSCRAARNSVWPKPKPPRPPPPPRHYLFSSTDESSPELSSCISCRVTSSTADIIIDVNEKSFSRKVEKIDGFEFDAISELNLPPISTKPKVVKLKDTTTERYSYSTSQKESKTSHLLRNSASSSPGIKLRPNSPRMAGGGRRSTTASSSSGKSSRSRCRRRRSLSQSFAIVKSSRDPQRDFKDSMAEMIVENRIRASKDLEELLACYLLLNSDEYHGLIVKAFQQILFDIFGRRDIRL